MVAAYFSVEAVSAYVSVEAESAEDFSTAWVSRWAEVFATEWASDWAEWALRDNTGALLL
jgi:hypothetical protein